MISLIARIAASRVDAYTDTRYLDTVGRCPNALLSFREGATVNSATAQGSLLGRGSYVGDFWKVK